VPSCMRAMNSAYEHGTTRVSGVVGYLVGMADSVEIENHFKLGNSAIIGSLLSAVNQSVS